MKAFDDMQALSAELGVDNDVLYKHDPYQATVAACVISLNQDLAFLTLPPGSDKTFVIGLLFNYYKQIH